MQVMPLRYRSPLIEASFDKEYCSGAFSDELDQMGLRQQVAAGFQLNQSKLRFFGRARTVRLESVKTDDERIREGLGFLEQLSAGDVLVVQASTDFAYFGELMTRLALRQELAGVVIDGLTRDSFFTQTVELPILSRGYSPVDIKGRGRVAAVDVPISIGNVECKSGDFIFADNDAAVVLPESQLSELLKRVHGTCQHEKMLKAQIAAGASVAEILKKTAGF